MQALKSLEEIKRLGNPSPQSRAIAEWKGLGRKVMGWVCTYVPEEVVSAAGLLPTRIVGRNEEIKIEEANAYLYLNTCSFARSCLEWALAKHYQFLDGLAVSASCDGSRRLYDVWKHYMPLPFMHILSAPRKFTQEAHDLFYQEVLSFTKKLEEFTSRSITDSDLLKAIEVYNRTRSLLRQLYELRKEETPPISGAEVMEVLNCSTMMPREQFNQLLETLLIELRESQRAIKSRVRLMLSGSVINNTEFIKAIEDVGGLVVTDELCTGSRYFWEPLEVNSQEPLKAIASHYLKSPVCARMIPSQARYAHIQRMVKEFRVQGAINQIIRYCVPHGHDAPEYKDFLNKEGVASLQLDVEYGTSGTGQIRTRVEAFIEMLEKRGPTP